MSILLYPPYLQWEIISECNHKCIHCYNYWRADNLNAAPHADFDAITEQIIARKPVYAAITGGEPLLVFDEIRPCIQKLIDAGIRVSVSSNGTLITEEIAEFYERNHIDTVISFPSADPDICDAVCSSHGVTERLRHIFGILKRHNIQTTINIVLTKLNLPTLRMTLEAVKEWRFTARVGIAQRPINASDEYLRYELDRQDFRHIVSECTKAKRELGIDIDFSVCVPDCAFDSEEEFNAIDKGECYAGSIAYSIGTDGSVKACQCDIKTYGNILRDDFAEIYSRMSEWRDGGTIPVECSGCSREFTCRGGCRIEAYARGGDIKTMPAFADRKRVPSASIKTVELQAFDEDTAFTVSPDAKFLKDMECYRVSSGIAAVHLTNEFAEWLRDTHTFTFQELLSATGAEREELALILNMLAKNQIITAD